MDQSPTDSQQIIKCSLNRCQIPMRSPEKRRVPKSSSPHQYNNKIGQKPREDVRSSLSCLVTGLHCAERSHAQIITAAGVFDSRPRHRNRESEPASEDLLWAQRTKKNKHPNSLRCFKLVAQNFRSLLIGCKGRSLSKKS